MPFINGQWIDEEQARMMAMRGANPMIYGGTFDTPMIYGGTTDVPDPMLYGGTTDVPIGNIFGQTASSPLQAFTEPSFTQPLAALNRQATGGFQGEGNAMDPAAINAAMGPQLAGPTVNQFRPTGSDYTPQQLSTPIDQLQQQNIPSNVVPIDPTAGLAASDPNLQGVTPFSQASSLNPFAAQASVAPQTSSLTPFASSGRTGYDKGPGDWGLDDPSNISTGVPTIIGPSKPGLFPWPPGEDPVTDDKGPGSGWRPGLGTLRDSYAPQPEDDAGDDFFGDDDVSGDYNLSSADINAMMSKAYSDNTSVDDNTNTGFTGTRVPFVNISSRETDTGSDEFGGINRDDMKAIFDMTKNTDIDFNDYWSRQAVIEQLLDAKLINNTQASQLKGHQLQQFNDFLSRMVPAITYEMWDEIRDSGAKGWGKLAAAIRGAKIGVDNTLGAITSRAGGDVGTQVDAAIDLVNKGIRTPGQMAESIPEMVSQVDTFDSAAAPKGALERKSDDAARAAAAQAEKDRQAQIAAANAAANALAAANARAKTAAANRAKVAAAKAASRKAAAARLAARKSAAQAAAAARAAAAVARSKAARQAQAAAQAQAQSEANAAIERVAQARALMGSRAFMESGMGGLSPAERDIVAAANVDTFAGISGMGMGFMGSNIGQEDGGGYTGGDFSSGQGWE